MNCPICDDTRLREVEKNGIMIDVCPTCKGVWLDRGELDKLMNEARQVYREEDNWEYEQRQRNVPPPNAYPPNAYPQNQHRHDKDHYPYGKHKKKKSVMDVFGDLFD